MSVLDRAFAAAMPLVPRPVLRRLSRRYIAGEEREPALRLGRSLQAAGYRVTYDVLGEAVRDRAMVEAAVREYEELLAELRTRGLEANVSLKPTQMGLDLDENLCFESVARITRCAREAEGFVRFEMEDSPTLEPTLRVFRRLRAEFGGTVGCVLQARLYRCADDARALLQESGPLNVRVVKGIYVEPPEIAWPDGPEVNRSYLETCRLLLEGGAFAAAATHDEALVQGLETILEERPGVRERYEFQMLLGVREALRQELRRRGHPVRVYVPYGRDWRPYVLRRLTRNPRLARLAFTGLFRSREDLERSAREG